MRQLLKINEKDNVAVALAPLSAGSTVTVDGERLVLADDIPAGHKAALRPIAAGEMVIKYGFPIGVARLDIPGGGHVHVNNLRTLLSGEQSYACLLYTSRCV